MTEEVANKEKQVDAPEQTAAVSADTPIVANAKKKKISQMTLKDVNAKIAEVETTMGGLSSQYAGALLARKEELS